MLLWQNKLEGFVIGKYFLTSSVRVGLAWSLPYQVEQQGAPASPEKLRQG
jgi:hypothetical protein